MSNPRIILLNDQRLPPGSLAEYWPETPDFSAPKVAAERVTENAGVKWPFAEPLGFSCADSSDQRERAIAVRAVARNWLAALPPCTTNSKVLVLLRRF